MILDPAVHGLAVAWLVDALVAATLLLLIVLMVRRWVASQFGPQLAYALWAIPALRMVLPPLPLLSVAPPEAVAVPATTTHLVLAGGGATSELPVAATSMLPLWWPAGLVALWLIGVILYIGRELLAHRRLTRLFGDAVTVEWIGRVRVIESNRIDGPVSFGLRRPVIALPSAERLDLSPAERAIAIAHELAHHQRGDLWANLAAMLFAALHWFNPFLRHACRAFRFDQESACDATVLARADGVTRGTYARALAKAATGRFLAFSPPMLASPMLGADKLKERVSMLVQPDRSTARRGFGLTAAAVALISAMVLTATPVLADPPAPPAAPVPPAPPAAPAAPMSPAPPEPPAPPAMGDMAGGDGLHVTRIERNGTTIVLRTDHELSQAEIDTLVSEAQALRSDPAQAGATAGGDHRQVRTVLIRRDRSDAPVDGTSVPPVPPVPPAPPVAGERRIVIRSTGGDGPAQMLQGCRAGTTPLVNIDQRSGDANNASHVRVLNCISGDVGPAQRLSAMRQARASLAASSGDLPEDARTAALTELDKLIAELERDAG